MEEKEEDCGTLQKEYFSTHGDARKAAWDKMSFFCKPYTWVRHKLRRTHKIIRPDRTGCYVNTHNVVVCDKPNNKNKDIIWLTKEQSDHYKNVLKTPPVLPDHSYTAERKHSKTKTSRAGDERKYVADENNPWAAWGEPTHLDEFQLTEHPETEHGWGEPYHLDRIPWAEHPGTKSGWGGPYHLDEFQWAEHPGTEHGWGGPYHLDRIPRAEHPGAKSVNAWAEPKHSDRKFSGIDERKSSHKPVNIHIEQYGVLGGSPPANRSIVIVDPAGGPFLSNNSQGAAGASDAIYKYLGYPKFPPELLKGFNDFDARYHEYETSRGKVCVIHTIGPNGAAIPANKFDAFMRPGLTKTYENVFKAFIKCGKHTLRLLMVSGQIFSGDNDISTVTYEAISAALQNLEPQDRATLGRKAIEMCLFSFNPKIKENHKHLCSIYGLCPVAGGRKTLKRRRSPRSSPPRSGRSRTRSRSRF